VKDISHFISYKTFFDPSAEATVQPERRCAAVLPPVKERKRTAKVGGSFQSTATEFNH
jgi:hypothetical protein